MNERETELLQAVQSLLWKLNHNHDVPGYKGPARIDRKDATVRELQAALDKYNIKPISL